ncbi:MAG: suppressor of fused domain protein, partial [Deltaproteobacteria bacterium]|nr:suppressor of fused domain protein [Deltaproteobacteria bacterium]
HEIESPDFHLDVYWIKPNVDRNFSILMTNGVSSTPLETPNIKFTKYIELCMLLPSDWDLTDDNWKKPENFWPLDLLKTVGRYPSKTNTWLGFGHSMPTGIPIIGTKFTAIVLIKSKTLSDDFQKIKCGRNTIEIYTLYPLYLEELNFKIKNGIDALLELYDKEDISDIINIKRKNVCKNIE